MIETPNYDFYIWASFGMTALVMAGEWLWLHWQRRETLTRLKRWLRARERAA